jgi:hypothetical protein
MRHRSAKRRIKGLHENDFIIAAKINEIAAGMGAKEYSRGRSRVFLQSILLWSVQSPRLREAM